MFPLLRRIHGEVRVGSHDECSGLGCHQGGVEGQQEIWWQTRIKRVFLFVSCGVFTCVQHMCLLISLFSVMIYIGHICFPMFPLSSYFSLGLNCVHVLLFFCYLGLNYLFRAGSTMISDSQAWLSENATPLFQRMIIIHIIDPCKIPIFWYGAPTKIDNLGMI